MDWTPERDARLTKLWNQPDPVLSIRLIGSMMDTTHNAVVGRARRLKLPGRGSPIKGPVAPPIKRVGKETFGKIVKTMATPVHPQTQAVITFADWTRPPYIKKAERLPIPVGAVGRALQCQWIEADAKPWHMCGAQSMVGYSWCPTHKAMVFISRADAA